MNDHIFSGYQWLVLRHPKTWLVLVALLVIAALTQVPKIRIDASADSLMLQGDPALKLFREASERYATEEFLVITWQPPGELLGDASLQGLDSLAGELRALPGVSSVVTVLDVPLLESPPVSLRDVTSGDPLPSLRDPGVDRSLALKEFTTSPIYADLLVSRDGSVTAVQVNLLRDHSADALLQRRTELRDLRDAHTLPAEGWTELHDVEQRYKQRSGEILQAHSELVEKVRAVVAGHASQARLFVGGVPMIAADMVSFVRSDLVTFGSAILVIMVLVLAVIFRRVRWVAIPIITCGATVVLMLGLLAALDWRMTVISSNFVAVLLIITLAVCIHLIVRYRELHAAEPDSALFSRVSEAMRLMAVPCIYTALTTVVAFVSLVVSGIQPVIDFGWMMTVGIAVGLVLSFILVPCLILVWSIDRARRHAGSDPTVTAAFGRIADRHGRAIVVASLLLLVLVGVGVSRLQVENRFIDYFHESTEIYQGMELLDAALGGTIPLDILITAPEEGAPLPGLAPETGPGAAQPVAEDDPFAEDADDFAAAAPAASGAGWDDEFADDAADFSAPAAENFQPSYWFSLQGMREIDTVHDYVDSLAETGKVLSLSTTFAVVKRLLGNDIGSVELALVQKSLPGDVKHMLVEPYFSPDSEEARISVRVMETSRSLRRDQFLKQLHHYLVEGIGIAPERLNLTGMLVLYNDVLQSLFRSQILTLGAVFIAILLMFLLLFRSLTLALIALAPNLLAAGLVLGVMGLVGIPLDIMTITIAAIVVGIGVDDCIHYVHRYMREFPVDNDYRAALHRCHSSIGRAMYYTTLTVIIGFSTLTLSNFTPSIYFGLLTVLAMIVAVLGALLLLPVLIVLCKPLGPGR
ncbi:efflux RND transporter permease subunit [Haliea sp. E17]|uniref:efflux RND transporter permease subunit n=1 Tax=Haliea sp. E17 TaxID=3401576 RepID=UPI003AAB142F